MRDCCFDFKITKALIDFLVACIICCFDDADLPLKALHLSLKCLDAVLVFTDLVFHNRLHLGFVEE